MATTSSWKSSSGGHFNGTITTANGNKITKGRGRMVVKPILKKLQSGSEKNSLDLDRGWEDQQHNWNDYPASRSARDVSFTTPGFMESGDVGSLNSGPSLGGKVVDVGRPKFQHARSPSGASHASVGTTGSGTGPGRGGFVHPFQQTPRTATPPLLSYAGSMASIDAGAGGGCGRDYSPTITENEDDDYAYQTGKMHPYSMSQSSLRRPSLASQRTASFSDMHGVAQSSSNAKTSRAGSHSAAAGNSGSSRMVHGGILTSQPSQSFVASPTSSFSAAPLSPLRTSLEMGLGGLAPRLRSLSEQQETRGKKPPSLSDPAEHTRLMRERRAKFDEKERLKAEKAARKQHKHSASQHQSKDAEKRDLEMFQRQKHEAALYSSGSRPGTASGASIIYNRSSINRPIYGVDQFPIVTNEKIESNIDSKKGKKSGSFARGAVGAAGGFDPQQQRERKSAKNVWTNFVLWIRTTIFKLKRGD
ncbi:hypothetical protein MGG_01189 [Pyricularia oryzae 70-15]|uniref:Uncharacterized protein n=1 Tax=Pyricularia oryzae (strain 70-15 / ATCC MYA-4617 / FGSC 8958) TaxID=242507 RepID=G4MWX7_PYRO7|nr:uncharacterized protein MGG_01189 [Pyricularia oryzae 70-15]EHA54269.1 hypothetical protein MGG_01189 [Pyricularia oryzae 70-15]